MANLQSSHLKGSTSMAKRGFTVVEVLIAAAVGMTVLGVLTESFISSWNAQRSQEVYGELQRAGRLSLDEISKQVWNATSVTSSTVLDGTTYSSGATTAVLRLPPLDGNGDIITGDDYMIFRQNGTKSERLISPLVGSARASLKTPLTLNQNTELLQFRYFNAAGAELIPGTNDLTSTRTITVTARSSRTIAGRTYTRQVETTILLRNKAA